MKAHQALAPLQSPTQAKKIVAALVPGTELLSQAFGTNASTTSTLRCRLR